MKATQRFLFAFCAVFLVCDKIYAAKQHIPTSERSALLALFKSAHGESWKETDGWISTETSGPDEPGTECDWSRVKCDERGLHVIELSLHGLGLRGTLPAAISGLTRLQIFDCSSNHLEGEIPKSLFRLRQLVRLDLSANLLRGSLALANADLPKLKFLNLARNYLGGGIEGLANIQSLVEVDMSSNRFRGPFPKTLGLLSKLEGLDLSANALTGDLPPEIGNLSALRGLSLADNHLTGKIPDPIESLRQLAFLSISHNHFNGAFPSALSRLAKLEELQASHNEFSGAFPSQICQASLRQLNLSNNQLTGQLPVSLKACKSISRLDLKHNGFRGALTQRFLNSLEDLTYLDLSANHLSGALPSMKGVSNLSILNLSDNNFTGKISGVEWPDLRVLRMDRNQLSGVIPERWLSDSLEELTLSGNQLNGELPPHLCDLTSLRIVNLSHNSFQGQLCSKIDQLEDLRVVDLSFNHLSGGLPAPLIGLQKLTKIIVSHNSFAGALPSEVHPVSLQEFDISFNRLTGALPSWLGKIPLLISVNLRSNNFNSGLAELVNAKTLRFVDIRENDWTEIVPSTLTKLQSTKDSAFPIAIVDPEILAAGEESDEAATTNEPNKSSPKSSTESSLTIVQQTPTPSQGESNLVGIISDATGEGVPQADVAVTSDSITRTTKTSSDGHFAMLLPPGQYRLTFAAPGFKVGTIEQVTIQPGMTASVNAKLQVGQVTQTVEVSATNENLQPGPWWNSWITRRGASEDSEETILKARQQYSLYLELSSGQKRDLEKGELSTTLDRALRERLVKMVQDGEVNTSFVIRISVIGRALALGKGVDSVAEWSYGTWLNHEGGAPASAVLNVDLSRLLLKETNSLAADNANSSILLRGGGVRFGLDTLDPGCAAVAISIWDDTGTVPLDHLVHVVNVGGQSRSCAAEINEQEAVPSLYSVATSNIAPDIALHVFNFTLNGATKSASFMALRTPVPPCASYSWAGDATLNDLVLNSTKFAKTLADARDIDGYYSSVGEQIADAVFPSRQPGTCGSAEAFDALRTAARDKDVRVFARISDQSGRLLIVPLALLAMFEDGGQRVFAHDIRLFQPIARETLGETDCVSSWTFVLPAALDGINDPSVLEPPPSLNGDTRVIRSKSDFIKQFINIESSSDSPSGLLLLAHHQDGVLTFSKTGDTLGFNKFERDLGDGSIAVLSACETTNLSTSTKLVDRLNDKGVDGLIAASFELDTGFGIRFAFNFAQVVANNTNQTITLEDAFEQAVSATVSELTASKGDRARGMSLELVLAGNPRLKICPSTNQSH